jgi:hypothetical protein
VPLLSDGVIINADPVIQVPHMILATINSSTTFPMLTKWPNSLLRAAALKRKGNNVNRFQHKAGQANCLGARPSNGTVRFSTLLGAFAKLRKATISFIMSVCPSARNYSSPTGRIFMKFDTYFRKYVEKIQVSLKSDKNNGYFTRIPMYIFDILLNSS